MNIAYANVSKLFKLVIPRPVIGGALLLFVLEGQLTLSKPSLLSLLGENGTITYFGYSHIVCPTLLLSTRVPPFDLVALVCSLEVGAWSLIAILKTSRVAAGRICSLSILESTFSARKPNF
jgi:hypothetical protein